MGFVKRAFLSVTRRKGKSFILLAVILILGNVLAGAVAIGQSTKNVEKQIKSQLGAIATLEMDWEGFDKDAQEDETLYENFPMLDRDVILKAGENPRVKYYDYTSSAWWNIEKLQSYRPEEEEGVVFGSEGDRYLSIKGIRYAPVLDIEEGLIELAEGRTFEEAEMEGEKYVCLISDKVAEANNLHAGDQMVIDATVRGWDQETGEQTEERYTQDIPFEVVGIYRQSQAKKQAKEDMSEEDKMNQQWVDEEQLNTVYVPADTLYEADKAFVLGSAEKFPENYSGIDDDGSSVPFTEEDYDAGYQSYTPCYILKSPEDIEAFRSEVDPLLPKYFKVVASSDQYDSVAKPVQNMGKMANLIIIIAAAATVLIIALVVILFLRDRKHELGIYLSLGEKKGKVAGQILLEMFAIALIAMTLAVFSGNVLAGRLSENMLQTATEADAAGQDYIYSYSSTTMYMENVSLTDVNDAYEVVITPLYIGIFYLIGIGTVLIASVLPLIYILRLNPKKIMM